MFRALFLVIALSFAYSASAARNHCFQFLGHEVHEPLVKELAYKLKYNVAEFCNSERIQDIFIEDRLVYHRSDDQYHPYKFITIHYNEYSCEYSYDLNGKRWGHQECYNTW